MIVASDGLHVDHSIIITLLCHQLLVCTNLCHFASVDHSNDVGVLNGGHVMGYHYRSTICEHECKEVREDKREREIFRPCLCYKILVHTDLSEPFQGQLAL